MTPLPRLDRHALLDAPGTLLVMRATPAASANAEDPTPQVLIAVAEDDAVTAFSGHVDLGTGIGTVLAQVVAE